MEEKTKSVTVQPFVKISRQIRKAESRKGPLKIIRVCSTDPLNQIKGLVGSLGDLFPQPSQQEHKVQKGLSLKDLYIVAFVEWNEPQ